MLTKFTLLFTVTVTAISAFLLSVPPKSIAFNATIMAPVVVIDEAMPSPTTNTVSLNLSFEIHPQAMDLFETVSTECQDLYEKYQPIAMDKISTASDDFARFYDKYQPLACELIQSTIRPLAMDLLDTISTDYQELYEKYEAFTEDFSVSYSLFAYGRIEVTAVSYDDGSNRTSMAMQTGPAPAPAPLATTTNLISTNVTNTQIAHAPFSSITKNLTAINAINLTKVEDGIIVKMGTVAPSVTFKPQNMACPLDSKSMESDNMTAFTAVPKYATSLTLVQKNMTSAILDAKNMTGFTAVPKKTTSAMDSKNLTCPLDQMNATSFAQVQKKNKSAMDSKNTTSFTQENSTAFTLDSKNITSSTVDSKTNMISHENVTPTSAQDITPALPLDISLEQAISVARDLFDAFNAEEYYESFHELVLGCIRTHFSFAVPLEMATNLPEETTPSTNSSRYEDDSQDHGNNNNYSTAETSDHEYTMEELLDIADHCVKDFAGFVVIFVILLFGSSQAV
eukprot:CAMPEP_0113641078 /NCGR_PEP_ID=MMETSP0017_2-20120614/21564_1 /TAXON_ID=2856 /ORGANISM="Cylindrotheca closterium" /LENGTH=509 /DNA_ID=CAMNT_0000552401 /DNA_START=308 /DNA_END=1837 /DNA_ORIENTATION=- /assembly_acc=CAM_ASM_000147